MFNAPVSDEEVKDNPELAVLQGDKNWSFGASDDTRSKLADIRLDRLSRTSIYQDREQLYTKILGMGNDLPLLKQKLEIHQLATGEGAESLGPMAGNLVRESGNPALQDHFRSTASGVIGGNSSYYSKAANQWFHHDELGINVYPSGLVEATRAHRATVKGVGSEARGKMLVDKAKGPESHKARAHALAAISVINDSLGKYKPAEIKVPPSLPAHFLSWSEQQVATQLMEHMNDTWAKSSSDGNSAAVAFQMAVASKFRDDNVVQGAHAIAQKQGMALYKDHKGVFDSMVDTIYEDTQAKLKAAGVEKVTLFRGMGLAAEDIGIDHQPRTDSRITTGAAVHDLELDMNPISSFSMNYKVAKRFAKDSSLAGLGANDYGSIAVVEVPRDRIFATSVSGIGCLTEAEVLVTGEGPLSGKVMVVGGDALPGTLKGFAKKTNWLKKQEAGDD